MDTDTLVALIALGGTILGTLGGTVLGARLTSSATRREAEAAREEARRVETERRQRQEQDQRRERGVRAAEHVLDLMNEVDLGPFSFWKAMNADTAPDSFHPQPDQSVLEPYYNGIRRHAIVIADPVAREAAESLAAAMYEYHAVEGISGDTASGIWSKARDEAERCLGAYIRGEPVPEPTYLREAETYIRDWWEQMEENRRALRESESKPT